MNAVVAALSAVDALGRIASFPVVRRLAFDRDAQRQSLQRSFSAGHGAVKLPVTVTAAVQTTIV